MLLLRLNETFYEVVKRGEGGYIPFVDCRFGHFLVVDCRLVVVVVDVDHNPEIVVDRIVDGKGC